MEHQFHASGKILVTSEFLILHGAKALAVPLTLGQSLKTIPAGREGTLLWQAKYKDEVWFSASIEIEDMSVIDTSSEDRSKYLLNMLNRSLEINPDFRKNLGQHDVVTNLEFDPHFGFGSSSTLTHLVAQWAGIDPMQLHFRISRGSGYDVACAGATSPILYQVINEMPVIQSVDFRPSFIDHLWLVYLGQKQDSSRSVAAFLENYEPNDEDTAAFSGITMDLLHAADLEEFGEVMEAHENRLSEILQIPVLKSERFSDLEGYAKSLGAWGGDFALIATPWTRDVTENYFRKKGIRQWFPYDKITL